MKKYLVDKNAKEIGFDTFKDLNENIDEIVLPEGLLSIRKNAFFDNINLKKINIPNSVKIIEEQAFWGLDNLKEIILKPTIKTIMKHAFCNCVNLTIRVACTKNEIPKGWNDEFFANIKCISFANYIYPVCGKYGFDD